MCAARQASRVRVRSASASGHAYARTAPGRTKTRIKARDCTHSQARMEGRSTDRSGAAGGVYTRQRRVPLARCEKDVAIIIIIIVTHTKVGVEKRKKEKKKN